MTSGQSISGGIVCTGLDMTSSARSAEAGRAVSQRMRTTSRSEMIPTGRRSRQTTTQLMRRLRICAQLTSELEAEFGPEGEARRARAHDRLAADPLLGMWLLAAFAGPEALPAAAFEPDVRARLLG